MTAPAARLVSFYANERLMAVADDVTGDSFPFHDASSASPRRGVGDGATTSGALADPQVVHLSISSFNTSSSSPSSSTSHADPFLGGDGNARHSLKLDPASGPVSEQQQQQQPQRRTRPEADDSSELKTASHSTHSSLSLSASPTLDFDQQQHNPSISREQKIHDLMLYWQQLQTSSRATQVAETTLLQPYNLSLMLDAILRRYSEPHRFYHTVDHIWHLYQLARIHHSHLAHPRVVGMAIFFHDAIYDPKRSDNERESRGLFLKYERQTLMSEEEVYAVSAFIMATVKHETKSFPGLSPSQKSDLEYFLDFDLDVLSWERSEYVKYSQNIRKEYQFVPESDYRAGRVKVLRSFLERPVIYFTKAYQDAGKEETARQNLEWEIRLLVGDAN